MIVAYWLLQIFNVVAGMANAALAVWNLARGEYMSAAISSAVAVVLAVSFVKTLRNMARFKFEEREHAERVERLLHTAAARAVNESLDRGMGGLRRSPSIMWVYLPQLELDECLKRGVCPDCAKTSLDMTLPITCRNPQCGSRFNVDTNGKWSRLDENSTGVLNVQALG
jgi:hypothetical protein